MNEFCGDFTHLVEAHDGGAQRLHVGFGLHTFLPAAPLEIVVNEVASAGIKVCVRKSSNAQPHNVIVQ